MVGARKGLSKLSDLIKNAANNNFIQFAVTVAAVTTGVKLLRVATSFSVKSLQRLFTASLAFFKKNPIILGISLAVGGISLLAKHSKRLQSALDALGGGLGLTAKNLIGSVFAMEEFGKEEKKLSDQIRRESSKSIDCLLYTSPSPRDRQKSRMPSSA